MPNTVIVAIGILVALCWIGIWLCENAPEGYEDEDGFHYGRPEDKAGRDSVPNDEKGTTRDQLSDRQARYAA